MSTIRDHIRDLLIFYIDTNYNHHLKVINKPSLDKTEINNYVRKIYAEKRDDAIIFIKSSLKQILEKEYPGDNQVMNLINSQDDDENLIKNIINHIELTHNK